MVAEAAGMVVVMVAAMEVMKVAARAAVVMDGEEVVGMVVGMVQAGELLAGPEEGMEPLHPRG